jgi:hypothetical protein
MRDLVKLRSAIIGLVGLAALEEEPHRRSSLAERRPPAASSLSRC